MGNSLGGRRRAKVMKIDGSVVKVKPPALARDILRDHPGHVLLESEQVKQLGVRATPLDPDIPLKPNKLYFIVELPKPPPPASPAAHLAARRVRSGINMSAKDRLESLMLSRRTVSDISFARAPPCAGEDAGGGSGPLRVRLRLPRAQVERLVEESRDPAEVAQRIMDLCAGGGGGEAAAGETPAPAPGKAVNGTIPQKKQKRMRFALGEDEIIS
uniref:Uncharacterized protein At1g66480 n=1 Tax=Anthurium amnicola TaxID=1678845 RepID=A0A1D1XWH5_9ARAE